MATPHQRYRGVRQRHRGSWVSEIRHPLLKIRIWLGTYETAEEAARAYEEAARLFCGPRARTNFPVALSRSCSSPTPECKYLSPALTAKLQRYNSASTSDQPRLQWLPRRPTLQAPSNGGEATPDKILMEMDNNEVELCRLEDHQVEQMIEELLDSNLSVEFCCNAL